MRPWRQICLLPSWPLTSYQGHTEQIKIRHKNAGNLLNEWTVAERKEGLRKWSTYISILSPLHSVWLHLLLGELTGSTEVEALHLCFTGSRGGRGSWLTAGWAEPSHKRFTLTRHEKFIVAMVLFWSKDRTQSTGSFCTTWAWMINM